MTEYPSLHTMRGVSSMGWTAVQPGSPWLAMSTMMRRLQANRMSHMTNMARLSSRLIPRHPQHNEAQCE